MTKRTRHPKKPNPEVLDSLIRSDGVGEDAVVQDLLGKFTTASDVNALEIGAALSALIHGQTLLTEQVSKLTERMMHTDEETAQREIRLQKFIDETRTKAESIKYPDGSLQKDRSMAQGAEMYKRALAQAVAQANTDRLKFQQEIASMPKVAVMHPGIPTLINNQDGSQSMIILALTIRINGLAWELPPGKRIDVPLVVANRLQEMMQGQAENDERKVLLQSNKQNTVLSSEWDRIGKKYGVGGDAFPNSIA